MAVSNHASQITIVEFIGVDGSGSIAVKRVKDALPCMDVRPQGLELIQVYLTTPISVEQRCNQSLITFQFTCTPMLCELIFNTYFTMNCMRIKNFHYTYLTNMNMEYLELKIKNR